MIGNLLQRIQNKWSRGFTLIETLVAVLMLTLALAGPLTIASKGLLASLVAKDQFIAFYLAQDAVEYVRYLRDSSCLANPGSGNGCPDTVWLQKLNGCLTSVNASGCYLDSTENSPASVTGCSGTCPVLRYNSTTKIFNYDASSNPVPQRFIRTVTLAPPTSGNPDEYIVTVSVSWTDMAGVTRVPITVQENLYRWQ